MNITNDVAIVTAWGTFRDVACLSDLGELDELYVCPVCGNVETLDNYDVIGADAGMLFCNQCNREVAPTSLQSQLSR